MIQLKTAPLLAPPESLSLLLQYLSALCEDSELPRLQVNVRRNNRVATLTIDVASAPENRNGPLLQVSCEPVERGCSNLEQAIVHLLGEAARPLKSAVIAQCLGVISETKLRKAMGQLLKDKLIFKPPKHPRHYWLTARPLPCDNPG